MSAEGYILTGYHSVEARFALRLATDLKNEGVNLWMDRLDIQPGDHREATQESALSDCAALLTLLSPDYVASAYGRHELAYMHRAGRPVLPVLLRPISPQDWLSEAGLRDREYVDMTEWYNPQKYQDALDELLNRIRDLKQVQITKLVNPERRYLNTLLMQIESQKTLLEYVRLSYQSASVDTTLTRPAPRIDPNRGLSGPFILRDAPLAQAKYLHSLKAALQEFPRLVLAGASGSGKTTTLYRLVEDAVRAYKAEPRGTPLPFLVNLAEWRADVSLEDFLRGQWSLKSDPLDWLARGWITLYLDGLDEMSVESQPQIDALRDWLHGATAPRYVVVTCRLANYDDRTNLNLPVICIEEMTDSRIQDMIRLHLGEEEGTALLKKFTVRDDAVARNPFLLRLVIYLHISSPGAELSHTGAEIIRRFMEMTWERERILQSPDWIPPEDLFARLATLAFDMLRRGTSTSVDKAYVAQTLLNERLVDALCSAGLMDMNGELVRFMHPLMLHVLAAMQLQHETLHEYLQRPAFSSTGRRVAARADEAVIMLTGLLPQADTPVSELADADPYLAAECLAAGAHVSDLTRRLVVSRLVYFATTENAEGRAAAIQAMELLSHGDPLPLLLDQMRYAPWEERVRAGAFLQQTGTLVPADLMEVLGGWQFTMDDNVAAALRQAGDEAIPVILRLLTDTEWMKRRGAAWVAGRLADRATVPTLISLLQDPEGAVRYEAVAALRRIQDADAVPYMLLALRDADNSVRKAATQALAEVGASAVPGLLRMLRDDNPDVRRIAAGVLGRVGDASAVPALTECLTETNVDIRAMAVTALGQIAHPGVVADLVDHLTDMAVPRWSPLSISEMTETALMRIGTEEAVDIVEQWRKRKLVVSGGTNSSGSAQVVKDRLIETTRLTRSAVKRTPSIQDLLRAIRHKEARIRRKGFEYLGRSGDNRVIPALLTGLRDSDGEVRWAAVKALGNFPATTEILQRLLLALHDAAYVVSDTAADILARIGQPALPGLLAAAATDNTDVRGRAIEALGQIGDASAVPLLIEALEDDRVPRWEEKRISQIAAEALDRINTPEAQEAAMRWRQKHLPAEESQLILHPDLDTREPVPVDSEVAALLRLVEEMHDVDWQIRQRAAKELNRYARALRGIRNLRITERLTELLEDGESFVRLSAVEALAWIGDVTAVPALIQRLKDTSFTVRIAAIRALGEIGHISALPAVAQMLDTSFEAKELVREVAAEMLSRFASDKALPALVGALSDPAGFVRRAAVESMGEIGSREAIPWLIQALHEGDEHIRWSAVEALGKLGAAEAVNDLARYLHDTYQPPWQEQPELRLCDIVALALEQINTDGAQAVLEDWRRAGV